MGILNWLFPSTRPARYTSVPLSPPPTSTPQVLNLKLVPKIFDLEGDGDLIWTGFMVEDQEGNRYGIGDPLLAKNNFHIFRVAGVLHRSKQLQNESFAPATLVELIKEDSNPYDKRAVSVWDTNKKLMVGYVPREMPLRSPHDGVSSGVESSHHCSLHEKEKTDRTENSLWAS